jgi:hypothetical protein
MSYSKMHGDNRIPICKKCLIDLCFNKDTQDIDYEEFKNVLRQIDKPYVSKIMQSSINQYNDTYDGKRVPKNNRAKIISLYFKNINSLPQYKSMNWTEGIEWEKRCEQERIYGNSPISVESGVTYIEKEDRQPSTVVPDDDQVYELDDLGDFKVTQDIIRLFGPGYKTHVYKAMWDKYEFLKQSYPDVTNLHTEALVTYVRFKTQEELATARGDADEAKTWSDAAMKAADKAKINPSQLSQSDLQGGLNSFSELLQAVEKAVDVIPILPRFKYRPNDAIDFNIWCLVNYIRDLEGKPLCEYEDVYAFYDKRKAEYVAQYGDPYGIFTDDPTEKNRETVTKFIDIPSDTADTVAAEDE